MPWHEHASARRARPPLARGALPRPRLLSVLSGGAGVVLLQAPAGYGKTTAFAAHLADLGSVAWYTLDADDADPQVFAAGVVVAAGRVVDAAELLGLLDRGVSARAVVARAAQLLQSAGALLVLDEAQHLAGAASVDVLRELLGGPRLALLSRVPLSLPGLAALELGGEVLRLGAAELSFDEAELTGLLAASGVHLSSGEARLALSVTEGWPIAARFLTQALSQGRLRVEALRDLELQSTQLGALFEYLAQEVLGPLEAPLRSFLTRSSVFEELTAELLADVLGEAHAGTYLEALASSGTFLTGAGGVYRAHPLLRAHLRTLLPDVQARTLADRGAAHFERSGQARQALHAHLRAGNAERAAQLLALHGSRWLTQGRVRMVERSLDALGPDAWDAQPMLWALAGDVRRAQSRFGDALDAYGRAPRLERLLGCARVYLDTVQPALAEPLLLEAARVAPPELQAGVAALRAENALNAGDLAQAERLDPGLRAGARFALRSGDLGRALLLARDAAGGELGGQRAARNHREALLLQSLLQSLTGELQGAQGSALAGLAEGERLGSPFVCSLAHARLGHARLAGGDAPGARGSYERALELAQGTEAPRLLAEPLMGLAHLDALGGRVTDAGERALGIARGSGDGYMAGLVCLTAALGHLRAGHARAAEDLRVALDAARACGDAFGAAAAALGAYAAGDGDATEALEAVLAYPFLLTRPGLMAPRSARVERAALLSRLAADVPERAAELLGVARELGYAQLPAQHPGIEVRVQLLERLALFVGGVEVRDWGRAKARDLLVLLALRPEGVAREAAQEALYPDADPGTGERNFRIVLHALGSLLEPGGAYFLERGEWLRLRRSPDLRVDLHDAWADLSAAPGAPGRAERLLGLPGRVAPLELEVAHDEAERYATRLPEALAEEAQSALAAGRARDAERLAQRALAVDAAHEPAARALMRAQFALGNVGGVARAYAGVQGALRELGLSPLPETEALFRTLAG